MNRKSKPSKLIKRSLIALGIVGASVLYFNNRNSNNINDEINLKQNSTGIEKILTENNSQEINQSVQYSLKYLNQNNEINNQTYVVMFDIIANLAEDKPEIMDYFGNNAKNYLQNIDYQNPEDAISKNYNSVGEVVRDGAEGLVDGLRSIGRATMEIFDGE